MGSTTEDTHDCGDCGWHGSSAADSCPVCLGKLHRSDYGIESRPRVGQRTFSLSTLLLFVTLGCVLLGAIRAMPGMAFWLIVITVIALKRTIAGAPKEGDHPRTTGQVAASFAVSVGVAIVAVFAASIAFLVACSAIVLGVALNPAFAKVLGEGGTVVVFVVAVVVGILCAKMVGAWVSRGR